MTHTNDIEFKSKAPLRFRVAKRGKLCAVVLSCAALAGVGTSLAYLTDTDSATNNFSVVRALDIDLVEPAWDNLSDDNKNGIPDAAEQLVPLQTVTKDPRVKNLDGTSAWMFTQVVVPTYDVQLVGSNGKIQDKARAELFTYNVSSSWKEIGTGVYDSATQTTTHTYAYSSVVGVGETTAAVFEQVQLVNLADGQLSSLSSSSSFKTAIDVKAYGIQSKGFTDPETAWAAYTAQLS